MNAPDPLEEIAIRVNILLSRDPAECREIADRMLDWALDDEVDLEDIPPAAFATRAFFAAKAFDWGRANLGKERGQDS